MPVNPATSGLAAGALNKAAIAGASSTQLTSPQGVLGSNNSAGKTLLGG